MTIDYIESVAGASLYLEAACDTGEPIYIGESSVSLYGAEGDITTLDKYITFEIAKDSNSSCLATAPIDTMAVAQDDFIIVKQNAMNFEIHALANDYDIDGDTIFIESFTSNSNSTVEKSDDSNSLIYSPEKDFLGIYNILYTVPGKDGAIINILVVDECTYDIYERLFEIYNGKLKEKVFEKLTTNFPADANNWADIQKAYEAQYLQRMQL